MECFGILFSTAGVLIFEETVDLGFAVAILGFAQIFPKKVGLTVVNKTGRAAKLVSFLRIYKEEN